MKLTFDKGQCFVMPAKFYRLLNTELAQLTPQEPNCTAITLNFRDPDYSVDAGGYHPVEVRLEKHKDQWQFIYITDFSYQGCPYPELVKEIDVCFRSKKIFNLYGGWLNKRNGNELLKLFIENFIEYHAMEAYVVKVSFD